jgi:hypothetical protein
MTPKFTIVTSLFLCLSATAAADTVLVNTGNVDGRMAMASRPSSAGKIEIEAADDFIFTTTKAINSGTFVGLIPTGSNVKSVTLEIYRVFPNDSANPPSGNVPTRVNSPSDIAFDSRSTGSGVTISTSVINNTFTAQNSVLNGINKVPNQTTGGEGAVTGQEVLLSFNFTSPLTLAPDHYFFVPQVELDNGNFFWLSSVRPIVSPGIPFAPDLQAWIRNENLSPDWLRVGTDIVGGATPPTFNGAFTLVGVDVPEPSSVLLFAVGALLVVLKIRRKLQAA